MNSIKYLFIALLLFSSCKKKETDETSINDSFKNGLLVLNEGLFQHNNSSLTWVDFTNNEVRNNIFLDINSRPLGDTGNDIISYGGKIYISVTGSSTVEVVDKKSLKSVKQIPFNYNNTAQEPRNLAFHNGKVFVSSFDGYVSAIDTVSLKITNRIKVGRNPEGICVSNESLFVANSGGLDFQNHDTTVFEINLNTMIVIDTFKVGENPGALVADKFDNVYVVKRGDYNSNPSELIRINTSTKTVTNLGIAASTLSMRGDLMYISYYNHSTSASLVSVYDCASQTLVNPSLINNQEITTLFGVVPFKTDQLICLDAMNYTNTGYLRFFNQTGSLTNSIQVGLNPNSIIHYE